jgi:hypothetical protein
MSLYVCLARARSDLIIDERVPAGSSNPQNRESNDIVKSTSPGPTPLESRASISLTSSREILTSLGATSTRAHLFQRSIPCFISSFSDWTEPSTMPGFSTMPANLIRPGSTGILTVILFVVVGMLSFLLWVLGLVKHSV